MFRFIFFFCIFFTPCVLANIPSPEKRAEIQKAIKSARSKLQSSRQEQLSADLNYMRCFQELRKLLSQNLSFLRRMQSEFGMGEILVLSVDATPETKALYNRTLRACEQKKQSYQQARNQYRQAQLNYLNQLSQETDRGQRLRTKKFQLCETQKEYISLLFRRIKRSTVSHATALWVQEYRTEWRHLRNLDQSIYKEFASRMQKKGRPVH